MLATDPGHRIPARVEKYKHRFDAMPRRDADELRETCLKSPRILRPELIVEKDAHRVQAVEPGPAQFGVDAPWVVAAGLEHLELIDGVGRNEVGTDGPTLRLVPTIGTVG